MNSFDQFDWSITNTFNINIHYNKQSLNNNNNKEYSERNVVIPLASKARTSKLYKKNYWPHHLIYFHRKICGSVTVSMIFLENLENLIIPKVPAPVYHPV